MARGAPLPRNQMLRVQMMDYLARANAARDALEMHRLLGTLRRRKWFIALFVLLCMGGCYYYLMQVPDRYRATGSLVIDGERQRILRMEQVAEGLTPGEITNNTQAAILQSRSLAAKVVARLKAPRANTPEDAVTRFLGHLTIVPSGRSLVLNVEYVSSDPEFAAAAVNALMEIYLEEQREAKNTTTSSAARWLSARVEAMRQTLAESEQRLEAARHAKGIVLSNGQSLFEEQLKQLSAERVAAKTNEAESFARLNRFDRGAAVSPSIYSGLSPTLSRAVQDEAALSARVSEMKAKLRDNHPDLLAAQAALADAHTITLAQMDTAKQALTRDYDLAVTRVQNIERDMARLKEQIGQENQSGIGLKGLQSEVDANRQLFAILLARYKETDVQGEAPHPADARIISRAVVPKAPFEPHRLPIMAAVGLMALIVACAVAMLREFHAQGFQTPVQAELELHLPVVATLPEFSSSTREMSHLQLLDAASQPLYAEAVRALRVALYDLGKTTPKVILVTSAAAGESKSLTALSLALTLKASGRSVLLVDADLRRSQLKAALQMGDTAGLADFLGGRAEAENILYQDKYSGLYVIPAGATEGHPLDLLDQPKLAPFLAGLKNRFDVIILDAPPVGEVRDAVLLSRSADACLFLIRAETTPRALVSQSLRPLREQMGETAISLAISRINSKKQGYYRQTGGEYVYFTNYAFAQPPRGLDG